MMGDLGSGGWGFSIFIHLKMNKKRVESLRDSQFLYESFTNGKDKKESNTAENIILHNQPIILCPCLNIPVINLQNLVTIGNNRIHKRIPLLVRHYPLRGHHLLSLGNL